jgi:allantoinase
VGAVSGAGAIRARRVVTPDGESPATVLFSGGLITAVAGYGDAPPDTVDLPDNEVLLPGLVDSHVHVNEPGRTGWEGFATATAAAAAGGVTTIVDMPLNSIPATISVAALDTKRRAALGQLAVDVAFWGGAVPGNVADLRPLHDAGVTGFKCFLLPSGVAEFAPLDEAGLAAAMTEIASFGGLLIAHAEDEQQIEAAPQAHGKRYAAFAASRPPAAEVRAIERLLAGTRRTGCRTHIVHLAAAEALPLIRAAKAEGLPVTAETCPHYLTLRDKDIPDGATQFKCCPPIRGEANRAALWDGLGDGTIDCVVSDHSPCPPGLKGLPDLDPSAEMRANLLLPVPLDLRLISAGGDFGTAWGGIASLQLGLPVMWTAARQRGIGLPALAQWMAAAPARLTGLADRGAIAPGLRADLCAFAPDTTFIVDPARLRHRHHVTPYTGHELHGTVSRIWLAGLPAGPDDRTGQLTQPPGRRA